MIRQSKKDNMYSVEVENICRNPCVYATQPVDAIVFALREKGYDIRRENVSSLKTNPCANGIKAKVCLLGGTRESVGFYTVHRIR